MFVGSRLAWQADPITFPARSGDLAGTEELMLFKLNIADYFVGKGIVELGEIPPASGGRVSQPPEGDHKGLPYVLG